MTEEIKQGEIVPAKLAKPLQVFSVQGDVELAISTAKSFPRDSKLAVKEMETMALSNDETAQSCIYSIPRGDTFIVGKSVRLAEIAVMSWGNIAASAEIVDEDENYVYAASVCRDLEKNITIKKVARRRIRDKNNRRYNNDLIAVTGMAAASIAYRNAVFSVIPSVVTNDLFERIKKKLAGAKSGFPKRVKTLLMRLSKLGIDEETALRLTSNASVDEINESDYITLIGIGTAVSEGQLSLANLTQEAPIKNSVPEQSVDEEINTELIDDEATAPTEEETPAQNTNTTSLF